MLKNSKQLARMRHDFSPAMMEQAFKAYCRKRQSSHILWLSKPSDGLGVSIADSDCAIWMQTCLSLKAADTTKDFLQWVLGKISEWSKRALSMRSLEIKEKQLEVFDSDRSLAPNEQTQRRPIKVIHSNIHRHRCRC